MVMRIQRIGDEYGVVFSQEVLDALHLSDGAEVELRATGPEIDAAKSEADQPASIRYVSTEEALEAYRKTLPQHREAYIELAK